MRCTVIQNLPFRWKGILFSIGARRQTCEHRLMKFFHKKKHIQRAFQNFFPDYFICSGTGDMSFCNRRFEMKNPVFTSLLIHLVHHELDISCICHAEDIITFLLKSFNKVLQKEVHQIHHVKGILKITQTSIKIKENHNLRVKTLILAL